MMIRPVTDWFARPVLHVKDVDASIRFYVNLLGFANPWRYDEEGRARVAEVYRQCCALILANNLAPEKIGKAVMFISLSADLATPSAAASALDALPAEFEARGIPVKDGLWGYRLLVVEDLYGNQLLFNYPSEAASGGTAGEGTG